MSTTTTTSSSLCETGKAIARILDGASERAVLVADDGTVLHMNGAAEHFLKNGTHVLEFLADCSADNDGDWRSLTHSRIVMVNGNTTRSERSLHWVLAEAPCACCAAITAACYYHTLYICSKHERVREVVDHAFDPVITATLDGTIKTANEAATDLFGYTESELVGANVRILCGGGHAEYHDHYMQHYRDMLKQGTVKDTKVVGTRREVLGRTKSGHEFPCQLGVQIITDVSTGQQFFCGFFQDLTYLKQHEAELEEKQALSQGMINASFDSMLEIDDRGIIQVVNDAACHMFGYTREEFLGSNISMICGEGHEKKHDAYLQRYHDTGVKKIIGSKRQVKAKRKDGSELEVELGVQEVVLTNGKKAFCGFIRDLTAQRKDKRALRKQQQLIHGKFFGGEEK